MVNCGMSEFINAVFAASGQFILTAADQYKDELRWLLRGYVLNPIIVLIWGILSLVLERSIRQNRGNHCSIQTSYLIFCFLLLPWFLPLVWFRPAMFT